LLGLRRSSANQFCTTSNWRVEAVAPEVEAPFGVRTLPPEAAAVDHHDRRPASAPALEVGVEPQLLGVPDDEGREIELRSV
jgi:hypothetical protein